MQNFIIQLAQAHCKGRQGRNQKEKQDVKASKK